jgi:macrolide-specific efflux system membrane fusion protein
MKITLALVLFGVAATAAAIAQQPARVAVRDSSEFSVDRISQGYGQAKFRVSLINEAQVPGQEPGVIVELNVVEGQQVKADEMLGKTDDTQPRMQGSIAYQEHSAAKEKAENEVDILYAQKASEVAKAELDKSIQANSKTANVVSDIDIRRQRLQWERGQLETQRAKSEKVIAGYTANAKGYEVEAAKAAVKRHEIRSPIDGVVEQVHLHKGEWVKPGDPVLRVVQLDRLKVEGEVEIAKFTPAQLLNRPVIVEAELQGRKVQFNGNIAFVSPFAQNLGTAYLVKAEIENRIEDGQWLLRPGMFVDMKIQTK